jgi:hypothetical protein
LHRLIKDVKEACEELGIPHHFGEFSMPEPAEEKFFADHLDQGVKNVIEMAMLRAELDRVDAEQASGASARA